MRAAREEKRGFLKGRRTSWLEMVPIRGVEPPTFALRMRRCYIFTPLKTYS